MPIPSTQELRRPLLEAFRDEAPHSFLINDFLKITADSSGENLDEMSEQDKDLLKDNIKEARRYLKSEGLLSHPSKGVYKITRKGLEALENDSSFADEEIEEPVSEIPEIKDESTDTNAGFESEPEIEAAPESLPEPELETEEMLNSEPEEQEENTGEEMQETEIQEEEEEIINEEPETISEDELEEPEPELEAESTESESESLEELEEDDDDDDDENDEVYDDDEISSNIDEAFAKYNSDLADEILERITAIPPYKFEKLVIDLLSKMGYFAFQTARYTTDSQGNELIHGVIIDHENPGANPIYVQARKSSPEKVIERSDMEEFTKVLIEKGGRGIFATLATFSDKAAKIAENERVLMIDGQKLASLMVSHNFCVNVEKIFEVKIIDSDAFNDYGE